MKNLLSISTLNPKSYPLPPNRGFTLLEMLLSIAMIGTIAGISVPVYQSFQTRNDLDITAVTIAQSLRRAQVLSQAVDGNSSWGVRVQSGSVSVFQGSSFATRNASFDETFAVPTSIVPSGLSEVTFAKQSGLSLTTGTFTLTTNTNETRNISINEKGVVSY